ncbi:MAG: hypothetical protein KGJ32_13420 [Xanthomonadaceae bacterium]|nr:hypothetical protein [Xanthomonadaceae bacterium]
MPGLSAKVAFLRRPDSYPEQVGRIETLETHMSWLFLSECHVYKLKKPFRHDLIDYGTPAARRLNCLRELRLNRRLAPDVYLAMVALTVDAAGRLGLDGDGRRIDWLVKMRRMPAELTLEHRLRMGTVDAADIGRIMARLVPFFADAPRAGWTPAAYRRRLLASIDATAVELMRPEFGLAQRRIAAFAAILRGFVEAHADMLDARVRAGHIVEGHGDLRPEHIYLTESPTIVDCIEFNRELRLRDPVDELAFLAMECGRLGRPEPAEWLFQAYRELSADDPAHALVEFHAAHNAFVRAKIALWHLDDPHAGTAGHWTACANDFLRHAWRHARRMSRSPRSAAHRR